MESDEVLARRAARFTREAAAPPPPLPVKRFAHPEALVVKRDTTDIFLQKRLEAGLPLTEPQKRALQMIKPGQENASPESAPAPPADKPWKKKKRGLPPKSCLITPTPVAALPRTELVEDSPCFHHLSAAVRARPKRRLGPLQYIDI